MYELESLEMRLGAVGKQNVKIKTELFRLRRNIMNEFLRLSISEEDALQRQDIIKMLLNLDPNIKKFVGEE